MSETFDPELTIDRYFDGELDAEGFARLQAWLEEHPAAATAFAERAFLHSRLSLIHAQQKASDEIATEEQVAERVEELSALSESAKTTAKSPLLGFLDQLPAAIHPVHHPVWFLATAAVFTALFWVLAVAIMWPRGGGLSGDIADHQMQPLPFTARLTRVEEAVWPEGAAALRPGVLLFPEQQINLVSGRLQIQFGDGARAAIEGPAALHIDGRNGLTLEYGRLLAQIASSTPGFTVQTPVVDVVDLGTEFGVNVRPKETEVEVFDGKVEVLRTDDPGYPKRLLTAGKSAVFGVSPQQGFYVKEKEMNRAIYLSLAVVLSLPAADMARGGAIGINFQGGGGSAGLVGSQTAGYVPAGNWNDISGPTLPSFPFALQDDGGNASGVSVTVATPNANGTGTFPIAPMGAGDIALLRGNIYTSNSTPVTITLSGTIPYQQYDVYVYFNGAVSNNVQTFSLLNSGMSLIQAKDALETDGSADTAFVLANGSTSGNYVVFSGLNNSTLPNFILTAIRNPGIAYGYLNGLQIVDTTPPPPPAPEPATSALLGIGGLVLLTKAGRKLRKK